MLKCNISYNYKIILYGFNFGLIPLKVTLGRHVERNVLRVCGGASVYPDVSVRMELNVTWRLDTVTVQQAGWLKCAINVSGSGEHRAYRLQRMGRVFWEGVLRGTGMAGVATGHCNCTAGWMAQMCDQRKLGAQKPRMAYQGGGMYACGVATGHCLSTL